MGKYEYFEMEIWLGLRKTSLWYIAREVTFLWGKAVNMNSLAEKKPLAAMIKRFAFYLKLYSNGLGCLSVPDYLLIKTEGIIVSWSNSTTSGTEAVIGVSTL